MSAKAKMILIDRDESIMIHGKLSKKFKGLQILDDVRAIEDKSGIACLANQYTAIEMFGADQGRPVVFSGDRHTYFTHGVCMPNFNHDIKTDEAKILDLFKRIIQSVREYNSANDNKISVLAYDLDEITIPKTRMLPVIPKVVELVLSSDI